MEPFCCAIYGVPDSPKTVLETGFGALGGVLEAKDGESTMSITFGTHVLVSEQILVTMHGLPLAQWPLTPDAARTPDVPRTEADKLYCPAVPGVHIKVYVILGVWVAGLVDVPIKSDPL
jgi:hypothetical protein